MNERRTSVAFLTGQSDPQGCALSPVQRDFLDRAGIAEAERISENFPYASAGAAFREMPILRASFNNARQYLSSRSARFSEMHRASVMVKFEATERVIFLAGSCGLELLINLRLPPEFLRRVEVFAYGPVSRSLPRCARIWLVQGRSDFISRAWHREVQHRVDCHHMNYLQSPEVLDLFQQFYQSRP